jgi:hypothetical protein
MLRMRTKAHDRIRRGALVLVLLSPFLAGSCNSDQADPLAPSDPTDATPNVPAVDTAPVVDSQPPQPPQPPQAPQAPQAPPGTYTGLPYGPSGLWSKADVKWGPQPFTGSQNYINADSIVQQINAARAMGHRLILVMTGGLSTEYTTDGKFDMTKWTNKMDTYNTQAIKDAVAAAVSDGTVIANQMIDEPETRRWGGNITKATLDEMATYGHTMFPTLPMGLNHGPPGNNWRSTERYQVVDYVLYQYNHYISSGDIDAWRTAALKQAKHDGVTPMFSINVLDGGVQDRDGDYSCTGAGQAGTGTYAPNCRMTPTQVRDFGRALATDGCFLMMWEYDAAYMSEAANQDAFREIASLVASQPQRSCARP